MANFGVYADGRTYPIPRGWDPVSSEVLDVALSSAVTALGDRAIDRVRTYYDPASDYAGDLLTASDGIAGGVSSDEIDPSDLFAVTTLSIRINPRAARTLMRPSATRSHVRRSLAAIPVGLPINELDADPNSDGQILSAMKDAYDAFRTAHDDSGNSWVFAAKLLARKRPHLAPVRDNVVCSLLQGGGRLRRGGLGSFTTDVQVFAYLMTASAVTARLSDVRRVLDGEGRGGHLEASDLRLRDVVMWTSGVGHWDAA